MIKVIAFGLFLVIFEACGVKGPPLPPMASTPSKSDRQTIIAPRPSASPSNKR